MSKPENQFITSVHAHLPPNSRLYRMKNNNMFNAGIADCWYSGPNGDVWIEWKFITVPKMNDTVINFLGGKKPMVTALQKEWLMERRREKRTVRLGVGSKDGGMLFEINPAFNWALTAREFVDGRVSRAQLAAQILYITGAHSA
jgi:hypothetical protein